MKPSYWQFRPRVQVHRSDDGTFTIHIDWIDSFQDAEDEDGNVIADDAEIGCTLLNQFLTERFGGFGYDMAKNYLPAEWVEPETEEQKERRLAVEELCAMRAELG